MLVDDEGVPRVKCNGGSPLAEPDGLGDLSDDEALDEERPAEPRRRLGRLRPRAGRRHRRRRLRVSLHPRRPRHRRALRPPGGDERRRRHRRRSTSTPSARSSPTRRPAPRRRRPRPRPRSDDTTTTTTEGEETTTTTVVLGTGDVQVTLEWDSDADLDLAVTDPTGEEISFSNRGPTATGGELDVDSNVGCDDEGSIENIFWPPGQAPAGGYVADGHRLHDRQLRPGRPERRLRADDPRRRPARPGPRRHRRRGRDGRVPLHGLTCADRVRKKSPESRFGDGGSRVTAGFRPPIRPAPASPARRGSVSFWRSVTRAQVPSAHRAATSPTAAITAVRATGARASSPSGCRSGGGPGPGRCPRKRAAEGEQQPGEQVVAEEGGRSRILGGETRRAG